MRRNRRDRRVAAALAAALLAAPVFQAAAQDHRQLGAHRHGHGTLAIAIEGNSVQVVLEAPGADIAGFEHPAESSADKAKVAAARKTLGDATALLTLPVPAGCKLASAAVELEGEEEQGRAHRDEKGAHGEASHAEFHAEYAFLCADADAITEIAFPYFKSFPRAEALDVTLVTGRGQKSFAVSGSTARIDLRDMR
jgi:hypothetical protein